MHFPHSTLALLSIVLVALVSTSAALPTTSRSAATYEPLFRPASPHVGPNRSIERLRQRRANLGGGRPAPPEKRSNVKNPKAKRSAPVTVVVANPKTKRSSSPPASVANVQRRSLIASNPKAKRAVVAASISITAADPVRRSSRFSTVSTLLKRFLGRRGTISTITVGAVKSSSSSSSSASSSSTPLRIPNPKSPKFSSGGDGSSTTTSSSTTTYSSTRSSTSTSATKSATSTTKTTSSSKTSTSTTTSATSTSTGSVFPRSGKQIAGGYYPDWEGDNLKPEDINYKMFDLINYSFAIPDENHNVVLESDGSLLNKVVKYAHGNGSKVLIAIGGWTDSTYFSTAVATASTRKTFVKNIKALVDKYNVDGVDIDWEYPGTQGDSGNIVSSADTANMLLFLQALRAAMPDKRLSTCTTQQTYIGANGSPISDVSAFADVLDNILVMNYDVWGASSTPGPNAPLSDACPNSMQPNANMVSAIESWTQAGMPASKILMGVPAYGYISSSSATSLVHKRDSIPDTGLSNRHLAKLKRQEQVMSEGHKWYLTGKARAERRRAMKRDLERLSKRKKVDVRQQGAKDDDLSKRDTVIVCPNNHSGLPCEGITDQNITEINWNPLGSINVTTPGGTGVFAGGGGVKVGNGDLSGLSGNQINFNDLINYGVLVKKGVNFVGANGYTRKWDDCSSTPFLYNQNRKVVVTYDDPTSLGLKGDMAYQKSIGGLAMWDMSGDTSDFQLTQSWRSAMGLVPLGY